MADPTSGDPSDIWQHGREYGAAEALDKLEGLLRAGWDCGFSRHCGFEIWNNRAERILVRGATLAEALAQVEDP